MKNEQNREMLKKFGRRMAAIRKSKKLSQELFAHDSGLARSHVSGIERGKINVSLSTIFVIAKNLDVEAKELLEFGEDN